MFKTNLVVGIRNLLRNKVFTLIHILGLAVGISASLVIFLIVRYETSFDKFETDSDRIYRLVVDMKINGMQGYSSSIVAPLPSAILAEVTGIGNVVPVMQFQGDASVEVTVPGTNGKDNVIKKQPEVVFTNKDYFDLLPFQWIAGSPQQSLEAPFSVVLTESRARQYFPGTSDVMGKQLIYKENLQVTVTGVVKDLGEVTDFTALEFISYSTIAKTSMQQDFMMERWDDGMAYSKGWLKLLPANDKAGVEKQINNLVTKHRNAPRDENNWMTIKLQPLDDVHFNMNYQGFGTRTANINTIYGLIAIAFFLLLLGCINFVNLSTAQSLQRAREVGIRKTIGSNRRQLIMQFLAETLLIASLATVVSISIVPMLLQVFSDFIPNGVRFNIMSDPIVIIFIIGFVILVSIVSGLYPSLVLSKFKPAAALKNQAFAGSPTRSAGVRKILTVSQFAIAQFFVIAAFMITKQIHFSLNQELGYRKDAIISVDLPFDTVASHVDRLKNDVRLLPGVQKISTGFLTPAMGGGAFGGASFDNGKEKLTPNAQVRWGDSEYLDLFDIKIVAGRNVTDGKKINEVIINETLARELGFNELSEAIGHDMIRRDGSRVPIVGVMGDFHQNSFHQSIGPVYYMASDNSRKMHMALDPQNPASWKETIARTENVFHSIYPEVDFNFEFYDDTIASFYQQEKSTSMLLNWAMGLSIFISCLGLLGLVIYISEARAKEIGVRKILGASVSSLVAILSKEFVVLIIVAFAIATPVSWYAVNEWLSNFAYKTEISWWVFVASGTMLLAIALITLGIQTIRAATSNPVDSLRNE